ncbi:MAG: metallophosphoesterase [Candidatus Delongbacteria bacterium]|nr:metallophosphoesterase [Candidatus Delongbacteria bacterium]MCG2759685.1 metallophosphoesterase [Candidatus Delongbacteria bacterium]
MRTLIIGDIHGCYDELQSLLEKFDPNDNDKIFSVGDVINRGPESKKCIDLLKQLNVKTVMGNHEYWYLKTFPFTDNSITSSNFRRLEIEERLEWIKSLPFYLITDDFIIVHAGFDPAIAFKDNSHETFVSVRTLNHTESPWFDGYCGTKHIYFGHWAKRGLFFGKNVTGLDSGCVYGGKLSGYIIEENRLIQAPAKKIYHDINDETLV